MMKHEGKSLKELKRKCSKCEASPIEDSSTVLHRFPKPGPTNSLRCELWAKFCFPHDAWHSPVFQNKMYSEHKMLCSRHFDKNCFADPERRKLIKTAAPDDECYEMNEPILIKSEAPDDKCYEMNEPKLIKSEAPDAECYEMNEPILIKSEAPDAECYEMNEPILIKSEAPDDECNDVNDPQPQTAVKICNVLNGTNIVEPKAGPSKPLLENLNLFNAGRTVARSQIGNKQSEVKVKVKPNNQRTKFLMNFKNHLMKVNRLQKQIKDMQDVPFMKEIEKNSSFMTILNTKFSPSLQLFLQGQLQNYKRDATARRWDTESKFIALRLFQRSPASYRLLRRMICLPSPSTLECLLRKLRQIDKQIKEENQQISEGNIQIKEENIQIKEENMQIKKENIQIEEENMQIEVESMEIKEESIKIKQENIEIKEENVEIKEENIEIKEEKIEIYVDMYEEM